MIIIDTFFCKIITFRLFLLPLQKIYTRVMKVRYISILVVVLLVADQILKIWVKTNFHLGEALVVIPDWFQLLFVENNGAAFGMQIASTGGFDWGKLALSIFRILLVGGLCYYTYTLARQKAPTGVLVGLALIIAGALGMRSYYIGKVLQTVFSLLLSFILIPIVFKEGSIFIAVISFSVIILLLIFAQISKKSIAFSSKVLYDIKN